MIGSEINKKMRVENPTNMGGIFRRLPYGLRLSIWYWKSPEAIASWAMLMLLLCISFGVVYITIWQNSWQGRFFDALQHKDINGFFNLVILYFGVAGVSVLVNTLFGYLNGAIAFRWRDWMTQRYMRMWLDKKSYYRIESEQHIDNPDQRIAEDLALYTTSMLGIGLGLLNAIVSAVSFASILWNLGGAYSFYWHDRAIQIPGYLVLAAIAYALGGSWLITRIGKSFVHTLANQQSFEAGFRYLLIYIRRGAEQIAFFSGEKSELKRLADAFTKIRLNFHTLNFSRSSIASSQMVYSEVGGVLPLLLVMPRFFADKISFGTVMQVRDAFSQFNTSLSFFVQSYSSIAQILATVYRIQILEEEINKPVTTLIQRQTRDDEVIIAEGLILNRIDGSQMIEIGDLHIAKGERWIIHGKSGVGKSTLLRAIAGLWTHGEGCLDLPRQESQMFVAQRPYFPIGTLKAALTFPWLPDEISDERCEAVLQQCFLPQLVSRLHDDSEWDRELSMGEQQRVAFCRVFLHKPALIFFDEATSAMDPEMELQIYRLVVEQLPNSTILSIAHGDNLDCFHERMLMLYSDKPSQKIIKNTHLT